MMDSASRAAFRQAPRREPDWEWLAALVEAGGRRKGLLKHNGDVALRQVGLAVGYSEAAVYAFVKKRSVPGSELLMLLADYFGDRREEWFEAGGFDTSHTPTEWTTWWRELMSVYARFPKEDQDAIAQSDKTFAGALAELRAGLEAKTAPKAPENPKREGRNWTLSGPTTVASSAVAIRRVWGLEREIELMQDKLERGELGGPNDGVTGQQDEAGPAGPDDA